MKNHFLNLLLSFLFGTGILLNGQDTENCFLEDWYPKTAIIPQYEQASIPAGGPAVQITLNAVDTLEKISNYIFGNAVAVWVAQNQNNPALIGHLQKLAPTLIRFPGGSWSDIYFWNGNPGDLPTTIPDGTNNGQPIGLHPQFGPSRSLTVDGYYDMRDQVGSQGLITINYGYARYGLSEKPAEQAAHYAAEWVRYDDARTKFWEIGNENAGPWEAGWQIDTSTNKDGQPEIITGELYGKHFKIFVDSMRAAAAELDEIIYIGGIILHYDGTSSWNVADRKWNEGFFREAGDAADFYVIHNYFGSSSNARYLLDFPTTELKRNINFVHQDITNKNAPLKPIALTEYNMGSSGDIAGGSFIKGMQAVILFCELIKLNYGMSARWLIANWEADGMFYYRDPTLGIPLWNPRPAFFYVYYLQRFTGDHSIVTTSSSKDVLGYASTFNSGETGVVVVNKGTTELVVKLNMQGRGVGERFYVYSLTGGDDNGEFSQNVYVNNQGPTAPAWGPENFKEIPASGYSIGGEIKFMSPARSVQYILIEKGDIILSVDKNSHENIKHFQLLWNYPNPFNSETQIRYTIDKLSDVTIEVYDLLGQLVTTLIEQKQSAGEYQTRWDGRDNGGNLVSSGIYFCKLQTGSYGQIQKMILTK